MEVGSFYFLTDAYFEDFLDNKLMGNKEKIEDKDHDRPSFYSFVDNKTQIHWLIPISSKISKFKLIYNDKMRKYGKCDMIVFGNVLGHEKAFLIQNMCPVIPKYIKNQYLDESTTPVKVDGATEQKLISKAKKVLALHRQGIPLIFPDVLKIEAILIEELKKDSL